MKRLDRLTEERQGVLRRRADAQLRAWAHQAAFQQADDVTAWAAQERATLAGLDYHGKRQRLDRLGVRVHVYRPDDEARRVLGRFDLAIAPPGVTPRDLNLGEAERLGLGLGTTANTTPPGIPTRRSRPWTRTTWSDASSSSWH